MSNRRRRLLAHFTRGILAGAAIHNFGWWVLAFLIAYSLVSIYIEELEHREDLGKLSESWRRLMDPKKGCDCAQCVSSRRRP